jgi:hypothetical protein
VNGFVVDERAKGLKSLGGEDSCNPVHEATEIDHNSSDSSKRHSPRTSGAYLRGVPGDVKAGTNQRFEIRSKDGNPLRRLESMDAS